MSLPVGARLGPYEITGSLGAGGMGEVYRARDTELGREVAVKVLPADFHADPDRLAGFQREAQVLASLNHPCIAAIHGLERTGGVPALVLELVEGETLADRLVHGPLTLDETMQIRGADSATPSKPRTTAASCTVISSQPTSRSGPTAQSRCSTLAWPRPSGRKSPDGLLQG